MHQVCSLTSIQRVVFFVVWNQAARGPPKVNSRATKNTSHLKAARGPPKVNSRVFDRVVPSMFITVTVDAIPPQPLLAFVVGVGPPGVDDLDLTHSGW